MTYSIEFEVHELPKMANIASGKSHWRYAHLEATKWKSLIWAQTWERKPKEPLERYSLTLIRFSSVECDFDGLVIGFKRVVDGLRAAGILSNDKISNSGPWDCRWEKCRPKEGKIRVKVVERE